MKISSKRVIATAVLGTAICATSALAGSVDDNNITTFSPGDTLTADALNETNQELVTQINDNALDIESVSDALLGLQQDVWVAVNSRASVSNVSNTQQGNECTVNYGTGDGFGVRFENTGTPTSNCDLVAGVSLPHGSTIKEMKCTQRATATSAGFVLGSQPISGTLDPITHLGIAAPLVAGNPVKVTSVAEGIFDPVVDNENQNYYVRIDIVSEDFSGPGAGANFGFYGCAIRVTPAAL